MNVSGPRGQLKSIKDAKQLAEQLWFQAEGGDVKGDGDISVPAAWNLSPIFSLCFLMIWQKTHKQALLDQI